MCSPLLQIFRHFNSSHMNIYWGCGCPIIAANESGQIWSSHCTGYNMAIIHSYTLSMVIFKCPRLPFFSTKMKKANVGISAAVPCKSQSKRVLHFDSEQVFQLKNHLVQAMINFISME